MNAPALLIDFGSTFTKVTVVDLGRAIIAGRAQAPSTVATNVCEGLLDALGQLRPILGWKPNNLDALLDGPFIRASSSAAGGLRMVVIGNVPGLTVEAANAAALGAGAKVVRAFGFKLSERDVTEITEVKPDMLLLTGGTDGGDAATILHNAQALSRSAIAVPIVVGGNRNANPVVAETLREGGKDFVCADNVMPAMHEIRPQAVQEEIRSLFMHRIIQAKGLDRIAARMPVVVPTPMAVLRAALHGAQGTDSRPGCGDLLLVDVGGATTDVHSVGNDSPPALDIIPKGMAEPFAKRTVEGDLGVRVNASTILSRIGADSFVTQFQTWFPEYEVSLATLVSYVRRVSEAVDSVPQEEWQSAADAVLARVAVDIAIERHVGRREPYYSSHGTVFIQSGKDMSETATLIGTGGIFACNPFADRILAAASHESWQVLRPERPNILLDQDYVLYAIGLLADSHPEVALTLFQRHLQAGRHSHRNEDHQHHIMHVHDDTCCE